MVNQISVLFSSKIAMILAIVIGIVGVVFSAYYIAFAVFLIAASIFSSIKLLAARQREKSRTQASGKKAIWSGSDIGYTMADGGKPFDAEKNKKKQNHKKRPQ